MSESITPDRVNRLLDEAGAVSHPNPPRRRPVRLAPGTLGQDFGSSSSKLSLCYKKREVWQYDDGEEGSDWRAYLVRIAHRADMDDPESDNLKTANRHEFNSFAALDADGEIKTGRVALTMDSQVPLKTIFVWRAGIHRREVLRGLPGGDVLLTDRIDDDTMDEAVKAHFRYLRKMAEEQASTSGISVQNIVLSFPNYLCDLVKETDPDSKYYDLDKYQDYYLAMMWEVWADHPDLNLNISFISEGQAAALYICETYSGGDDSLNKKKIWTKFEDVITRTKGSRWLPLAVVDSGSSSMSIQVQTVYFDEEGEVTSSQSLCDYDWIPGTTGGSHLTNERVKKIFQTQIESQPSQPGHLAELLAQYEAAKTNLDYLHVKEPLIFHTSDDIVQVILYPNVIQAIYKEVFKQGFRLFEQEMRRLIEIGDDFAILFCGGSYANKGLRQAVKSKMVELQGLAAETDVRINYLFLAGDVDSIPTTAVACGAALSQMYIPSLADNLSGSAFGVQALKRTERTVTETGFVQWDKGRYADFLFSKGCQELPYIDYKLNQRLTDSLKFQLVCDPNHYPEEHEGPQRTQGGRKQGQGSRLTNGIAYLGAATGTTSRFHRLAITEPPKIRNGPIYTYDLGFEAVAADLPSGMIRFRMDGSTATRLASRENGQPADATEAKMQLRCTKINTRRQEVYHPQNRRWLLTVKTDPASKLLVIDNREEVPSDCHGCETQIGDDIEICETCGHAYCRDCYEDILSDLASILHPAGHKFENISLRNA